jgi:lipopolysaccharide export system permease protein
MLFESSLRKELARSFGATLVVLVTIILTIVLIRTLGLASRGAVNPQDVMLLMAYATLGRLPTILGLSLFIAMVSVLSRLYRDSEMVVWLSSGRGLANFIAPLVRFSWPVLLVTAVSALWLWPWTNEKTMELRQRYEQRSDLDRVAPGQFQESSDGSRVFFIDRNSRDKSGTDIFIATTDKNARTITTARSGRVDTVNGAQVLTLQNGERLEIMHGQGGDAAPIRISSFESYGARISDASPRGLDAGSHKLMSTWGLLQNPNMFNQGELAWRLGLVFSTLNLIVMAVAMTTVNPRTGRSSSLFMAVFIFLVYNNLITLSQNWVQSGMVGLGTLMLAMHGGMLLLALAWLIKRHQNLHLPLWVRWPSLPRRGRSAA